MKAWGLTPERIAAIAARSAALAFFILTLTGGASLISAAQTGGEAGAFMFYGAGGRALAMGGAYYGISDDASAAYWNPAGLTQLQQKELTTMQATLPSTAQMTYVSYAHPTKKGSTFAVSMMQFSAGGFETVDVTYDGAGQEKDIISGGTFSDKQQSMALSWGKPITENLGFGLSVKQVSRALAGNSDSFMSMDVGLMKAMGPAYRLGFGLQNVFALKTGESDDKLPVVFKVGNSFRFFKNRLTLALDGGKSLSGDTDIRFGGEYWVARWFAFRFGLMGIPELRETDFGFGLKFKAFTLDIAQGIHDLGASASTRFSFTLKFGKSKGDHASNEVKKFVTEGNESFLEGNFIAAAQKLNQALDAQPGNKQVVAMLERLQSVTGFVPQAMGGEEFVTSVRKGVISYVDGRDLKGSVNALRHAYNQNVKDEKLLGLLNMVEKGAGAEITRVIEGPEQFTWIDQKIYDSRQSVYDGKYDAAVRRAQDVLDLEPNNVTALQIMGSAFYMMEQKDKALAVWRRAIELDPENREIREFIKRMKAQ